MKGQYFSFDAIVASIVFVLALMALLGYWHSVRSYLDYQDSDIGKEAIRISDMLFAVPAYSGSDCNSMTRLGLSESGHGAIISQSLIDCASDSMSQTTLRGNLSTPYNTSIRITSIPSGDVIAIGSSVPHTADEVVKIRRLATVVDSDGSTSPATVDVSLYR
jgi:hypothetical protein